MCYQPIIIYDKKGDDHKIASCRKCLECMQVRANEWALRGHFELAEHSQNCFLTLTYEDNPIHLIKEDLQNFIKRLRKKIEPIKIKYFSCGEYGDHNYRPHYHIIIFGYDFDDRVMLRKSQSDIPIYESKELSELWSHGLAIRQEANANTIRYSAKYSTKLKQNLPKQLKDYPEFNTMSQNLGIEPIMRKMETYLKTDQIYIDGFSYQIPEIILQKYVKLNQNRWDESPDDIIANYKSEIRNNTFTGRKHNEIKERLAIKKKQFTKLRQL